MCGRIAGKTIELKYTLGFFEPGVEKFANTR